MLRSLPPRRKATDTRSDRLLPPRRNVKLRLVLRGLDLSSCGDPRPGLDAKKRAGDGCGRPDGVSSAEARLPAVQAPPGEQQAAMEPSPQPPPSYLATEPSRRSTNDDGNQPDGPSGRRVPRHHPRESCSSTRTRSPALRPSSVLSLASNVSTATMTGSHAPDRGVNLRGRTKGKQRQQRHSSMWCYSDSSGDGRGCTHRSWSSPAARMLAMSLSYEKLETVVCTERLEPPDPIRKLPPRLNVGGGEYAIMRLTWDA